MIVLCSVVSRVLPSLIYVISTGITLSGVGVDALTDPRAVMATYGNDCNVRSALVMALRLNGVGVLNIVYRPD